MTALVERIIAARDAAKRHRDKPLLDALADAANALDSYEKTATLIAEADARVVAVLQWLDERGRNSTSYGSHADAYEIAARRLREAVNPEAAA